MVPCGMAALRTRAVGLAAAIVAAAAVSQTLGQTMATAAAAQRRMPAPRRFRALARIKLREAPNTASEPTGEMLEVGEIFEALEAAEVGSAQPQSMSGRRYLRVVGRRGWAFDKGVAGKWSGLPIVESAEIGASAQSRRALEDTKVRLSPAAVDRLEKAAQVGADMKQKEDVLDMNARQAMEEQRAVMAVRRALRRLQTAVPETFEAAQRDLTTVLDQERPSLGNQRERLEREAERALVMASQRVGNMAAQQPGTGSTAHGAW